jgi:hypothetical protein
MSATTPSWSPYAAVPHGHVPRKLGDHPVRLFAIGAILLVVVVITAAATLVHPTPQPCGLYCGPTVGPSSSGWCRRHRSTAR